MWWKKDSRTVLPKDYKPAVGPPEPVAAATPAAQTQSSESILMPTNPNQTFLGRSVMFRGELSGTEDLLIEGQLEGNISVQDQCVTVGPQGQVKGEIQARQVVIHGSVHGNVSAREKIEIRRTGNVVGDLRSAAIAIEEGAYFKGSIDVVREETQEAPRAVSGASGLESEAPAREGFRVMSLGDSPGIHR